MLHSQARDGADLADQCGRAMTQIAGYQFFQKVLPVCNALSASPCVRPVRGEPVMVNFGPTGALEWPQAKQGCQPLDRAAAGDLQDLLSAPSPLPQMKAHFATATHTVH
jgi:hypothetical protein